MSDDRYYRMHVRSRRPRTSWRRVAFEGIVFLAGIGGFMLALLVALGARA